MSSKVLFVAKEKATTAAVRSLRAKIVNNFKIIIFVLNYFTVLVHSYFEKGCHKKCARDNPER